MDERMPAQADKLAAAQATEWQLKQQQLNQLMAAFKQSQATGHGEGGLGLAKGDG